MDDGQWRVVIDDRDCNQTLGYPLPYQIPAARAGTPDRLTQRAFAVSS
jgi:hypothetical protein